MNLPFRLFPLLRTLAYALCGCALICLSSSGADRRVLLIAGPPSHSPGWHEYNAGMLLIQKCLAGTPGLKVEVSLNGWPVSPDAFNDLSAVLVFCDGGPTGLLQGERLKQLEAALGRGAGLGLLHYAVEPAPADEAEYLRWAGGCFEINRSVNPIWDADFARLPDHPILRGVQPFALRDEWYYNLRFAPGMKGVSPLLVAVPPLTSLERPDGPHEGNPAVRGVVAKGEPQCLSWAYDRPDGGRSFGFAGLHYHSDWGNENVRKLILNAVLWLAKMPVPEEGVASILSEGDLWVNLDHKAPRSAAQLNGDLNHVRSELKRLSDEIELAKAAGIDTGSAEISVLSVKQFIGWIGWDIGHSAELDRAVSHDEVNYLRKFAPQLVPEIPSQELGECLAVIDRARAELLRLRRTDRPGQRVGPVRRSLGEVLDNDRAAQRVGGNALQPGSPLFTQRGQPVFVGGFTWAPLESGVHAAFGPIASIQIAPANLASETSGLSAQALRELERASRTAAATGGRFDVFFGHNAPAWAVKEHPEIAEGGRQFVKYDIDHPLVRAMWRQLLAQAVPLLSASPASLHTYLLSNEPSWYTTKGTWSTGSVSEYTFAKFRGWLAERYRGDWAELNRRWGTAFISFEAVRLELPLDPAVKGSAAWYDWCRFNMDRVNAWFTFLRDEVRKYDPAALCHVKLVSDFWLTPRHERDNGIDYETLPAQVEDIAGSDSAPEPLHTFRRFSPIAEWSTTYSMGWQAETMIYDFLKSVAPNKPIYDSEYHAFSAGSWCAPYLSPDYVRAVLWLGTLHGLAVNQTWYWPRSADGSLPHRSEEGFYGSMGMLPVALDAYGRTMRELNLHASEVAALAAAPRPVRLFYSTDSAIQSPTFLAATIKAYEAAYFSGSAVGFVTEQMLAEANPAQMKDYPLVIIPSATHVSNGAVAQLRRYAAAGGTVVLFGAASLERTVYGDERPKFDLDFLGQAPRIETADSVESIGRHLALLAGQAGVHNPVSCRDTEGNIAWGIRCVGVSTAGGLVISLVNVGRRAQTVVLQVEGGGDRTPEDLLTGAQLGSGPVTLRPLEVRLLRLPAS